MRKPLLALVLLCLSLMQGYADEQKRISLSRDHARETVNLGYCNIFVSIDDEEDERGNVKIEVENLDESNALIIFDRAYEEKAIKRMPTSIRFDKTFGGTKNKRTIDPYTERRGRADEDHANHGRMNKVMLFNPSDKYALPPIEVTGAEKTVCRLPIYIAKFKGKKRNKLLLLEKQVIELNIEVELKPSAEYESVKGEYDHLMTDLAKQGICTNAKHKPSPSKQRENYNKKMEELKERIDGIAARHGWTAGDRGFARYEALKKQLDHIDLTSYERDCRRHGKTGGAKVKGGGHSCSYCSLSMQQIYHQLDDLYKRIYNSSDRKAAKASVMGKANALYKCASQRKGNDYKSKITERYNRISKF
jgi:hypothetical protein